MKKDILKVSLRNAAIYIPEAKKDAGHVALSESTLTLVAKVKKLGFVFSESLLQALNVTNPHFKVDIHELLKETFGTNKNWTPLVKGWDVPTGESAYDHFVTFLAGIFGIENEKNDTKMPCGHFIPDNTFPIERYNGCPYCGTPFEFGELENVGQGSKLKTLTLWTDEDVEQFFVDQLTSKTALDATQVDSLKILLQHYNPPADVKIGMKETVMLVIDSLIEKDENELAGAMFSTPADILRYLWYKHTGFLQLIKPKTIINRKVSNQQHIGLKDTEEAKNHSAAAILKAKAEIKLKYSRKDCRRVAGWMNNLALAPEKSCEIMHPQRNMWVRFIRALRLTEYAKKPGFDKLATLLDAFYNENYTIVQGRINHFRLKLDAENTFGLLKKRPGMFARSLFANMLWFGPKVTLNHFTEVADQLPARLLLTLNMYAKNYFNPAVNRSVKPLGGSNKMIPANRLLANYDAEQLLSMQNSVEGLCLSQMEARFAKTENPNKTIFIDEALNFMPLAIGDRSETIQDLPVALMGTRFPIEGDTVRLFMQWGNDLPAQHLDMDLSCMVAYKNMMAYCSYMRLTVDGCKHSGDIRSIPAKVGTAEYIDIDVNKLIEKEAVYVTFTCNSYSRGEISPGLVVGWMDSKFPMKISKKTGVAYDPSCVQHQVRITQNLTKGLVFGVLDVQKREIIWLEMSFGGQVVQNLNLAGVQALLAKLDSKMNIGALLKMKAGVQNLTLVDNPDEADEVYTAEWALNTAKVTQLLVD